MVFKCNLPEKIPIAQGPVRGDKNGNHEQFPNSPREQDKRSKVGSVKGMEMDLPVRRDSRDTSSILRSVTARIITAGWWSSRQDLGYMVLRRIIVMRMLHALKRISPGQGIEMTRCRSDTKLESVDHHLGGSGVGAVSVIRYNVLSHLSQPSQSMCSHRLVIRRVALEREEAHMSERTQHLVASSISSYYEKIWSVTLLHNNGSCPAGTRTRPTRVDVTSDVLQKLEMASFSLGLQS